MENYKIFLSLFSPQMKNSLRKIKKYNLYW